MRNRPASRSPERSRQREARAEPAPEDSSAEPRELSESNIPANCRFLACSAITFIKKSVGYAGKPQENTVFSICEGNCSTDDRTSKPCVFQPILRKSGRGAGACVCVRDPAAACNQDLAAARGQALSRVISDLAWPGLRRAHTCASTWIVREPEPLPPGQAAELRRSRVRGNCRERSFFPSDSSAIICGSAFSGWRRSGFCGCYTPPDGPAASGYPVSRDR